MFQQYLYRCTDKVIEEINIGVMEFLNLKLEFFTPEMILIGVLEHKNSGLDELLEEVGMPAEKVLSEILNDLYDMQKISHQAEKNSDVKSKTTKINMTPETEKLFKIALDTALKLGDKLISEGALFLAMFKLEKSVLPNLFEKYKLDYNEIEQSLLEMRKGRKITEKNAESKSDVLKLFTTDLTERARKGELDPVIGRDDEIMRIIEILSRRKKNNPILIGYPGVGKTVIVEGLAIKIAEANIPETLLNKQILQLEMAEIIAGAKFKGEFEERVKAIKDEIVLSAGSVILFIDETHTIMSGNNGDGMSASSILKPALANGQLQCIGTTTFQEYKKYIEPDKAIERRFQAITVEEPTIKETIQILNGLKKRYENHHQIKYSKEAIKMAAKLSEKYITSRYLPDKAIDLIDEAGAKKHLQLIYTSSDIGALEKKKQGLHDKQMKSFEEQNFENVSKLQQRIEKIKTKLQKLRKEIDNKRDILSNEVDVSDIAKIITQWTGIPADKMLASEAKKLLNMEQDLHLQVIGQDIAIRAISDAIRRNRAGIKDPNRPIGTFLFLGPTGVGKTELAKALAKFLMADEKKIIRLDMSEYMEAHSISKIIGSPPGYVGYGEGGQLTELVKRNPYSVILLDEIEKAHPNVFNILLQIFDEGHLTDAQGFRVSFKNTIIIGTSNLGGKEIAKDIPKIGFESSSEEEKNYKEMKNSVMTDVKKLFKPEFVNRLDDIIVFHALTMQDFKQIVVLELDKLSKRLAEENIKIKFTARVKKMLLNYGFSQIYGARPLKREIEKRIENPLSKMLITKEISRNNKYSIDEKNGEIYIKK